MAPVALLTFLVSVVVMAIAASLEHRWKNVGFPNNSYRDRERLLLVAGIWGIIVSRKSKPRHCLLREEGGDERDVGNRLQAGTSY